MELSLLSPRRTRVPGRTQWSGKSTLLKIVAGLIEVTANAFRSTRHDHPLPATGTGSFFGPKQFPMSGRARPSDDPPGAHLRSNWAPRYRASPRNLWEINAQRCSRAGAGTGLCCFDEPINHLDLPTIEWLESWLGREPLLCS
jgi:ATP-binding cassette subfamily F protein uup